MHNVTRNVRQGWLTAALWGAGIGLQLLAPLLRDRVPLSDDLLVTSMLAPWWLFLQVVLLAVVLRVLSPSAADWSPKRRTTIAILSAGVLMLPQPELLTQVFGNSVPFSANPVRVGLLWSTPLAFYLLPAALVVWAWIRRDEHLSLLRALGLGLVIIGILNFPFILWLTHLWKVYIRPLAG